MMLALRGVLEPGPATGIPMHYLVQYGGRQHSRHDEDLRQHKAYSRLSIHGTWAELRSLSHAFN